MSSHQSVCPRSDQLALSGIQTAKFGNLCVCEVGSQGSASGCDRDHTPREPVSKPGHGAAKEREWAVRGALVLHAAPVAWRFKCTVRCRAASTPGSCNRARVFPGRHATKPRGHPTRPQTRDGFRFERETAQRGSAAPFPSNTQRWSLRPSSVARAWISSTCRLLKRLDLWTATNRMAPLLTRVTGWSSVKNVRVRMLPILSCLT